MAFFFLPMSIPHRNDSLATVAGCPGDHNKSTAEIPSRNEPRLTIVSAIVSPRVAIAGKHFLCVCEIQAAFRKGLRACLASSQVIAI